MSSADLDRVLDGAHRRRRAARAGRCCSSTRFVSSLSCAISTAIALVRSVTVAWMRRRLRPSPSCTSERLLSRRTGMPRRRASSTIAPVDGPRRTVSYRRCRSSTISSVSDRLGRRCTRGRGGPPRACSRARPSSSSYATITHHTPSSPDGTTRPKLTSLPASVCSSSATCSRTCGRCVPSCSRSTNPPAVPRLHGMLAQRRERREEAIVEARRAPPSTTARASRVGRRRR